MKIKINEFESYNIELPDPHELFKEVYGSVPENCDFYERLYLWAKIKCAMSSGRSLGELFIMYNNKRFFVLSNEKELEMFKKQTYKHINALSNRIIIAENWVQEKRWKKLM
jgi:hypothetical protein